MKRKRKPAIKRDARGRFVKHRAPLRDKFGRFRKRKNRLGNRGKSEQVAKRLKTFEPVFNLCYAADRQDFYDTIIADRRRLSEKLSEENRSALRVEIDIIGTPPKKKTKSGRRSRRKTTAFIGARTFSNLHKLRNFLLMQAGYGRGSTIDWSRDGFCQYKKTAAIVLAPSRPGKRWRTLKKYKIES